MTEATMSIETDERRDFVEAIRDFARRECGTREQRQALTGGESMHSGEIYRKLADTGWLGVAIPEEYGGAGGGMVDACLFLEELGRGQIPAFGYNTTLIVAKAYERFGNEEQKREILGGVAGGAVEAIAMSEPGAGSDIGAMSCSAKREDGRYVVSGQKTWISNAHLADHILLVCRTDSEGSKHDGLTMLNVPIDTPGMEVQPIETMGGREVSGVFFSDAVVASENLVGREGQGWTQLMAGLNVERLIIAALQLGVGERAFDDALAYVKEREQFGQPIGSFQTIKHRLAELATEIECARLLAYDVAAKVDADPEHLLARQASMAKLKCTEIAKQAALEGMQMMGGYGYASEYDMEHYVRQTLVGTIYGGTSEVQREIIGKTLGL